MLKNLHINEFIRVMSLMKKRVWLYMIPLIIASLAKPAVLIIFSLAQKTLIDMAILRNTEYVGKIIIQMILVILLFCIVIPFANYIGGVILRKALYDLKLELFTNIQNLPMSYYDSTHSGDLMSRVTNDLNGILGIYGGGLWSIFFPLFSGLGSAFVMFSLNWMISLYILLSSVILALVSTAYIEPSRKIWDKVYEYKSMATQYFIDLLSGINITRIFNIDKLIVDKFINENKNTKNEIIKSAKKYLQMNSIIFFITEFNVIGTLIIGAFMIQKNYTDLGSVVAIISLQSGLALMFSGLSGQLASMQVQLAGAARIFEILDAKKEIDQMIVEKSVEKIVYPNKMGVIEFHDVSYSYEERKSAINGFNMVIKKGQVNSFSWS